MLFTLELPEKIVLALDRQVQKLRSERPRMPEWPFDGQVVIEHLSAEDQRKLLQYEAELTRYNAYRNGSMKIKCSRSTVAATALRKVIQRYRQCS